MEDDTEKIKDFLGAQEPEVLDIIINESFADVDISFEKPSNSKFEALAGT